MENKKNEKDIKASLHCEYCGMRHEDINELKEHVLTHKQPDDGVQKHEETVEQEIIGNIEKSKTKGRISWGSMTTTFILILLTSISALQAFESYSVMKKIEGGNFASASASEVPSSVDSLPNMVGGC